MKKFTIYIAGKMSGEDYDNCFEKFEKAQLKLQAIHSDIVVLNPFYFGIPWETPTQQAIPICLQKLKYADAIFMLSDWLESSGSIQEFTRAGQWGKKIFIDKRHDLDIISQIMHKKIIYDINKHVSDLYKKLFLEASALLIDQFQLIETKENYFKLIIKDKKPIEGPYSIVRSEISKIFAVK